MIPVFLSISETSGSWGFCSTTTHNRGWETNLNVLASLLRSTLLALFLLLIGEMIITSFSWFPNSFSELWRNSTGSGEFIEREDVKWLEVEDLHALVVGVKPVKNPITKHSKKWSMAFFLMWIFFLDLSWDPIIKIKIGWFCDTILYFLQWFVNQENLGIKMMICGKWRDSKLQLLPIPGW